MNNNTVCATVRKLAPISYSNNFEKKLKLMDGVKQKNYADQTVNNTI